MVKYILINTSDCKVPTLVIIESDFVSGVVMDCYLVQIIQIKWPLNVLSCASVN